MESVGSGNRVFRTLFFKELLLEVLNYRFVIAFVLAVAIIPLSFYFSAKEYEANNQRYKDALRLYEQSHKTIRDLGYLGGAVLRPPSSLSFISAGLEYVLPDEVGFSPPADQIRFTSNRSLDSPFSFLFGRIDLTFIVSIIMSLMTMLLTYGAIAGEKENRTLSQVLSYSVPRNHIILSIIAATGTLIGSIFLFGVFLGLVVLVFSGFDALGDASMVLRLAISIGSSLLYILVFALFCILISTINKRSITSIISMMFCWVILFMIVPKGSVVLSKILRPVESQEETIFKKEQIRAQYAREKSRDIQRIQKSMPGVKDMTPQEFFASLKAGDKQSIDYDAKQRELAQSYDTICEIELAKVDSDYESRLAAQASLARGFSRLSPVSCFTHIMIEMSNTGFTEYDQLKATRSRLKHILDTEIHGKDKSTIFKDVAITVNTGENLESPIPRIEYTPTPLIRTLASIWADFVVLIVYGFLFFAGSYVAFVRYDVR